jgi:8-oxo-dGTP pyrophosphatase MutT (NUDIX family)
VPEGVPRTWFDMPLTPAAVLVPVVGDGDELAVLLTQRTAHLKDHPGQVSFPGGRADPDDADAVDTALREFQEELGIARDAVRIVGSLEPMPVITGFAVTPVVGFLAPGYTLELDVFEVEDAFEVPLGYLLDERNLVPVQRRFRGAEARMVEYHYDGRRIWGATALMIRRFLEIIR